jgi:hypothetical protein
MSPDSWKSESGLGFFLRLHIPRFPYSQNWGPRTSREAPALPAKEVKEDLPEVAEAAVEAVQVAAPEAPAPPAAKVRGVCPCSYPASLWPALY